MRKVSMFRVYGVAMLAGLMMAASCVNFTNDSKENENKEEQQGNAVSQIE